MNGGLLLVHIEHLNRVCRPCVVEVERVQTPREMFESFGKEIAERFGKGMNRACVSQDVEATNSSCWRMCGFQ